MNQRRSPMYDYKVVALRIKMLKNKEENAKVLEEAINEQARLGYRLNKITTVDTYLFYLTFEREL
ncbi:MAG TPA: hypothetical protein DEA45_00650 [Acholeplasmataceae bacterium]|nr:hypothetical protein [Acholeplasmataceae bacterium]